MTTLRLSVVHAAAFALAIGQHGQAQAQGGGAAQQIEIVAQPLASAIARLNEITGAQIVAPADLVAGRTSAAIDSVMTPEEALAALIAGAPLDIETTPAGSYILISSTVDEEGALTEPDITTLQTIVVTARRTEEALVDVPGSVAVFSGDDIDRSNLTDTDDLTLLTPNAQFSGNDNPARIFFSIRGISDLNVASTGPTIGFFQDGVLQNSTGLVINSNRRVVDVERVEVLYGPQGTAFGRGTIGGAVNVVTNKPSDTFEASLRTEFGSYFDFTGEAVVNIPITEKLAIRAVGYGEISDGFVDAPFGDTEDSIGNENAGGRFSVRYTPTDRLTFDASVQVDRTAIDAPLFAIEETLLDGDPAILNGRIDELEIERINVVGEIQYDFDVGLLRSITAFNRTTFEGDEDFDFTPADATLLTRDNSDRAFSQEVRFESAVFSLPSGFGTISANGGFSYADIKGVLAQRFAALGDDPGASVTDAETDITHVSAFGDVRWRPIDQLELAVGARFSRDKVSFDRTVTRFGSFFRDPSISEGDRTFTAITPNASVLFDWTENLSTYFSFSTGFRPGGFVGTSAGPSIEFDEENVRSFEGGLKSTWLDGQLTVNASGYALFYNDIQVPIARAFGGGVENAATARSVGAEITVGTTPVPGLNLQAGLGLAYAKFTDFEESISGDQTGERLPRAPRTSFSFIGDYEHPSPIIADLQPFARVEYSYRSDFSDAVGDTTTLDGYDVTNFRLGVRGERLEVALFVENAFNELYATEAFPGSGFEPDFAPQNLVVPGETRRFGVVTTVRF